MNTQFQDSPPAKPSHIEWRALIVSIGVGIVLTVLQRMSFVALVRYVVPRQALTNGNYWLLTAFSIGFTLAAATVVGFVAAHSARNRPYFHAIAATLCLRLLNFLWRIVALDLPHGFAVAFTGHLLDMMFYTVISLFAALYGAYMAQSFKRNRGVKID